MSYWINDKLAGVDLETTSAVPLTALPVSFALVHFDFGKVTRVRHALIDPGVEIPPEATAVHGISNADVQARGGGLEASVFGIAAELLKASANGIPVVGMNLVFDLTVLDSCLRRFGEDLRGLGWRGPAIDVLVLDRHVDKWRKGKRTLSALCEHYDVDPGESHSAKDDTIASVKVAIAIAEKFPEIKHADVDTLFVLQQAWRREWTKEFSEYRVKQGQEPLAESEQDWPIVGWQAPKPYHVDPEYTAQQKANMEAQNDIPF